MTNLATIFPRPVQVNPASRLLPCATGDASTSPPKEPASDAPTDPARKEARELIDTLKRRSTLVGAVQPVAMFAGLAEHPVQTWNALSGTVSSLAHGDLGAAGDQIGHLGTTITHPTGISGHVYRSTLYLQTGVGAVVGGLEVYQGVKNKDKYLGILGGADILSAGSAFSFAMSGSAPAMGLGIASTITKVGLVLSRPKEYSRVQKVKVLMDAAGSVPSLMLKAGFLPLPAMIGNLIIGPTELLYMNSPWMQKKVDSGVEWLLRHVPHPGHPHTR